MKKYFYFFKLRFATGIQYRMASVTALTTQLIWGLMECLAYKAIAEASGGNLPMDYSSIVTYIWLKEALLILFSTWAMDNDLFAMIANGDIAYELCRPVSIYSMWFSRTFGARISEAILRCIPVLLCAFLMPETCRYLVLLELSPFAYMQNVPFRIYSGELAGGEMYQCILKQIFWLVTLMLLGIVIWKQAEKRTVIQGG